MLICISVQIKATITDILKRADGWCESVNRWIFPLLELSMKVEGLYPL